jgi:hypothetical protein
VKVSCLHPVGYGGTGLFGNLELDWPRSLLLHHGCSCGDAITVAYIADPEFDQVARAQFAVQTQIEQG